MRGFLFFGSFREGPRFATRRPVKAPSLGKISILNRRGTEDAEELLKLVDEPFDTISHVDHVEIEQEPQSPVTEFQERQQLGIVNWMQFPNDFELHHNGVLHQLVHAIRDADANTFVDDWHRHFQFDHEPTQSQLLSETLAVSAFE